MSALDILVSMLKGFEGCRLKAYQDIVGVWTIGYGETLGVSQGMIWTQEYAEQRLKIRAGQFLIAVLHRCPQLYIESPEMQAACASLSYNIGVGAFGASSVCSNTKRQLFPQAANSFLLWNKAGGRTVKGLTLRRQVERRLYLSTQSPS